MADTTKLSRREWFRLRNPRTNRSLGEGKTAIENDVLKPIEHPPNYDGLDLSELPPMREAVLSMAQTELLFQDIAEFATDVQLMQRTKNAARATGRKADSAEQMSIAKSALLEGLISRIQIRYRWQGALWIDTLDKRPNGVGIVRIVHANH